MNNFTYKILNEVYYRDLENSKDQFELMGTLQALTPFGIITVPFGFITDRASIPYLAQWLIPKSGKYNRPSIIHDYLYKKGGFTDENLEWVKLNQKQCDITYYKLMLSRGVSRWKAYTQYKTLRMLGFIQWNKYRKLDNERIHRNLLNKIDNKIKG